MFTHIASQMKIGILILLSTVSLTAFAKNDYYVNFQNKSDNNYYIERTSSNDCFAGAPPQNISLNQRVEMNYGFDKLPGCYPYMILKVKQEAHPNVYFTLTVDVGTGAIYLSNDQELKVQVSIPEITDSKHPWVTIDS